MKYVWLLVPVGLVSAALACEDVVPTATSVQEVTPTAALIPTATPAATATPIPTPKPAPIVTPTPLSTPIPTPTHTPSATQPDALSIFRAAEKNLMGASSFHITIIDREHERITADIAPPDRSLVHYIWDDPDGEDITTAHITIGESDWILYPEVLWQGWLALDESSNQRLPGFPYNDLAELLGGGSAFERLAEEVIDGAVAYRLTSQPTEEVGWATYFAGRLVDPQVDLWISQTGLLPLHIEIRDNDDSRTLVTLTYSDYEADFDISMPEEFIDLSYFGELIEGTINPERLGFLVRSFPVQFQQCIEAEIGPAVYSEVIAGESNEVMLVRYAFYGCEHEFPLGP